MTTRLASRINLSPLAGFLPLAFTNILNAELSETADENILPFGQPLFCDFKLTFYQFGGALFGEAIFAGYDFCKANLVESHDGSPNSVS